MGKEFSRKFSQDTLNVAAFSPSPFSLQQTYFVLLSSSLPTAIDPVYYT